MPRSLTFHENAWDDYLYWQDADRTKTKRINALLRDVLRHPFEGLGKPEPLRGDLAGFWSRRIDAEHRLVYSVTSDAVVVVQARYHY